MYNAKYFFVSIFILYRKFYITFYILLSSIFYFSFSQFMISKVSSLFFLKLRKQYSTGVKQRRQEEAASQRKAKMPTNFTRERKKKRKKKGKKKRKKRKEEKVNISSKSTN